MSQRFNHNQNGNEWQNQFSQDQIFDSSAIMDASMMSYESINTHIPNEYNSTAVGVNANSNNNNTATTTNNNNTNRNINNVVHTYNNIDPYYQHTYQEGYQQATPMMTPFDTAYGATLLPSHLLMGSPFMSSPTLSQHQYLPNNSNFNNNNSNILLNHNKLNYSSGSIDTNLNYNMDVSHNRSHHNQSSKNTTNMKQRKISNSSTNHKNNRSKKNLTNYNDEFRELDEKYFKDLFQKEYIISYKILPKGDDAFRTRSLLLENIDNTVNVDTFLENIVKSSLIESIFMEKQDDTTNKFILSFLTVDICLNFYNNILQRFKEYKSQLKSDSLTLNFVSLKYKSHIIQTNSYLNGNNVNEFDEILRFDLINTEYTRSIAVIFKDFVQEKDLLNKLDFLKKENGNKRYVLESIKLINAKKAVKHFGKHYCILTFLSINMAIEMLDYLNIYKKDFNIEDLFFVNSKTQIAQNKLNGNKLDKVEESNQEDNEGNEDKFVEENSAAELPQSKESIDPKDNNSSHDFDEVSFPQISESSILSSHNSLDFEENLNQLTSKLQKLDLQEHTKTIDVNAYSFPPITSYTDNLENICKSFPVQTFNSSVSIASTLRNQEMFINDPNIESYDNIPILNPPFTGGVVQRSNIFIPQTPVGLNPRFHIEPPPFRPKHLPQPITDSIENQLNTSSKIVSAMGGDVGNRTIYVGNINPRSKVEDVCNVIRGGILQNINFIESKHICFITFVEASAAVQFYANSFIDPIILHGNTLKLGWGKFSGPLPKSIALAVTVGASRNVYVSLPEMAFKDKFMENPNFEIYHKKYVLPNEEQLRKDFTNYGQIEQINYLSDSHCCWINFMNINSAIKLVEDANNRREMFNEKFDKRYEGLKIRYGKDRCGNINRNLIPNKKSKFTRKNNKKANNQGRLRHLEVKRKMEEDKKRDHFSQNFETVESNDQNKLLSLNSLGINIEQTSPTKPLSSTASATALDHVAESSSSNLIPQNADDLEVNENEHDNNKDEISENLELLLKPREEEDTSIHMDSLSTTSSELELIICSPTDANSKHDTLNDSNVSDTYKFKNYNGKTSSKGKGRNSKKKNNHSDRSGANDTSFNREIIAGSDVMAQYLTQIQHSTFMYAANILGATEENIEFYNV